MDTSTPGSWLESGWPCRRRAQLAQRKQLFAREVARLGEHGVKRRRRMPLGQDEAIALFPVRDARDRARAHLRSTARRGCRHTIATRPGARCPPPRSCARCRRASRSPVVQARSYRFLPLLGHPPFVVAYHELLQVAVEDGVHIARLHAAAHILYQLVGIQHVVADLAAERRCPCARRAAAASSSARFCSSSS